MIDSHVHFWQFNPIKDAWINDDMEVLQRDFLPIDLERVAARHGIDGVVAVQADQSEAETKFLSKLASQNSFIKGIVGWVDLCNKNLGERLSEYSMDPLIKGFRHILQAEGTGYMLKPEFIEGVKALKKFGLTYDILVYHNQLQEVSLLLEKLPDQKFIVDHCAKPPIANGDMKEWMRNMRVIAENKNVYCKISGLVTEAKWHRWSREDIYPYLDVVMDCFGNDRVVFGSDWPVIYTSATYNIWIHLLKNFMQQFDESQQDNFFSENAKRFYDL